MQISDKKNIEIDFNFYISCDEYIEKVNDEVYKRNYFIDLRGFSEDKLEKFFAAYDKFQEQLLSDIYFKSKSFLSVYIICDEKIKKDKRVYNILKNYKYADKHFITYDEYCLIQKYSCDLVLIDDDFQIEHNEQLYPLSRFNLIFGNNGSGKTSLLQNITDKCNSIMYKMNEDIGVSYVNDEYIDYLKTIYATNTGKNEYFEYLIGIIAEAREKNMPIIIDDLCWGTLDDDNKMRVIDILAKCSIDNMVAISACQNQIKRLVNNRVYNPNIIEL